jgi:tRNA(fMet)-specific endonuclease VapC
MNAPAIAQQRLQPAAELFLPAVVEGELYYGAFRSRRAVENIARIEHFASNCHRLLIDHATARTFGRLKAQLRTSGTMIPENDLWIGAAALTHALPLLTADHHFIAIEGLSVIRW